MSVETIIDRLQLVRLENEGGWFRRTRTEEGEGGRPSMTCIYALFTDVEFSAMHRLDVAETLFFHAGDPFEVFALDGSGEGRKLILGSDVLAGQVPQVTFSPGTWFGGRPENGGEMGYSLISAAVSPGFEWNGFELGERAVLVDKYPKFEDAIRSLTRL